MKKDKIKIGVYICHCGSNIAGKVDVVELTKFASTLDNVVVAKDYKYMCSDPGQDLIVDDIKKHKLNRIVVAACSPRMHEPTFRKACMTAGLNPYLFEMANIREHASWVTEDNDKALEKSKSTVRAAVNRVAFHVALEDKKEKVNPATLVIGGGIAGIQSALELANGGHKVYLVEKTSSIGGHMAMFDKTFPTLDCSACILTPKMVEVGQHPNIELMTLSEVEDVSGYVGNFKVQIKQKPRYIELDKCNSCGDCWAKCPKKTSKTNLKRNVIKHDQLTLGPAKAITMPFMQAVPNKPYIDPEVCLRLSKKGGKCSICYDVCEPRAINYDMKEEMIEIEVGNIIVATGFKTFDPSVMTQYGYGKLPNVITSFEFEKMSNASGPTGGKILMHNGKEPESIAIFHCIGSRDENYNKYCSRVCCMYSLKYAHLIKEKTTAQVYQLYIDMRAFGKGYEEFYDRIINEGALMLRGKAAEVKNVDEMGRMSDKLWVKCEDSLAGIVRNFPVDMVILSVGLEAQPDANVLGRKLSISCGAEKWYIEKHAKLDPVATMTDGVFVAGCAQGPKDIPDTVAQGAAASARVLSIISKGEVTIEGIGAVIDEELCTGCKICSTLCPYSAIEYLEDKKVSKINEVLCKACGTCVAACPSGAILGKHFTDEQIFSQIEGVLA